MPAGIFCVWGKLWDLTQRRTNNQVRQQIMDFKKSYTWRWTMHNWVQNKFHIKQSPHQLFSRRKYSHKHIQRPITPLQFFYQFLSSQDWQLGTNRRASLIFEWSFGFTKELWVVWEQNLLHAEWEWFSDIWGNSVWWRQSNDNGVFWGGV